MLGVFGVIELLRQAVVAPELHPGDVRLLLAAHRGAGLRGVPAAQGLVWLAETLHLATPTASAALERLSAAGFLDRQAPADPAQPALYRIPASRAPSTGVASLGQGGNRAERC